MKTNYLFWSVPLEGTKSSARWQVAYPSSFIMPSGDRCGLCQSTERIPNPVAMRRRTHVTRFGLILQGPTPPERSLNKEASHKKTGQNSGHTCFDYCQMPSGHWCKTKRRASLFYAQWPRCKTTNRASCFMVMVKKEGHPLLGLTFQGEPFKKKDTGHRLATEFQGELFPSPKATTS